jgi:hypothetical protein
LLESLVNETFNFVPNIFQLSELGKKRIEYLVKNLPAENAETSLKYCKILFKDILSRDKGRQLLLQGGLDPLLLCIVYAGERSFVLGWDLGPIIRLEMLTAYFLDPVKFKSSVELMSRR